MVQKNASTHGCWLMKSEPSCYSIDDLQRDKKTMWDGVRNYQVRNMMRDDIKKGDRVLFYHSNAAEIGVVGEMEVSREAYPDPTQFDPKNDHYDPKSKPENPRWLCVDVRFKSKFPRTVTLNEMKLERGLSTMPVLQKGNRLSVTPLSANDYDRIVEMSRS